MSQSNDDRREIADAATQQYPDDYWCIAERWLGALFLVRADRQPRRVPSPIGQRLRMQNRTYFNHRIDMWTDDGENIVEHLAGVEDFTVAIIDAAAPQALAGCRRPPCGRARG